MKNEVFNFALSTRIIFQAGAINELSALPEIVGTKCMLLTFPGYDATSVIAEIHKTADTLITPDKFEENPSENFIRELADMVAENGIETIVAIGGGSSIDTAKAAAWFASNPNWNLTKENPPAKANKINIIAVATTAGTGSEVTPYSILTDSQNKKRILNHPSLTPHVAICDPQLTATMPPHVTAHTGIDAICHSIEAYLSKKCNGLLADIALASIRKGAKFLPVALAEPNNISARSEMMLSALEGGIVLAHCGTVMVHALGYCLTGKFGYQHGLSNAILLAAFVDVLADKGCERAKEVSDIFNGQLAEFIKKCGINTQVPAIDTTILEQWTQSGFDSYGRANCVAELTFEDIKQILEKSLEIEK